MFRFLQPFTILAVLASSPLAIAQEHDHGHSQDNTAEQRLQDLLDEFLAGASISDAGIHDRFWAADLVYTSSDGERFGKAEIMDNLAEPTADAEGQPVYSSEDVDIRVFGDIAVVTFRLVAADLAEDASAEFFNTGVFQHRDGRWKAFTWQATRIPDNNG